MMSCDDEVVPLPPTTPQGVSSFDIQENNKTSYRTQLVYFSLSFSVVFVFLNYNLITTLWK